MSLIKVAFDGFCDVGFYFFERVSLGEDGGAQGVGFEASLG